MTALAEKLLPLSLINDSERWKAQDARLELELNLNRLGTKREVVILEAATEEDLRRTHRRYFESLSELPNTPA